MSITDPNSAFQIPRSAVVPSKTLEPVVSVRVVFFTGKGKFSKLIRWRTWGGGPAHVGMLTTDGKNVLHARPGYGVVVQPIEESDKPGTRLDILECFVHANIASEIMQRAEGQVGKGYDWAGDLGFVFRKNMHSYKRWFCSELVAWLFWRAGAPLLHRVPSWKYAPEDLWRSPLLVPHSSFVITADTEAGPQLEPAPEIEILKAPQMPHNAFSLRTASRHAQGLKKRFAGLCRGILGHFATSRAFLNPRIEQKT